MNNLGDGTLDQLQPFISFVNQGGSGSKQARATNLPNTFLKRKKDLSGSTGGQVAIQ